MNAAKFHKLILLIAVLLIGMAGGLLIYYSTTWGPWAFSDSAAYLSSARNLITGHGLGFTNPDGSFVPFTYYPPLYPLALAIPGLLGVEMVTGARAIDIAFFVLFIIILVLGSARFLRYTWATLALGALILASPVLVDAYSSMMSEPLFILTGFSGLISISYYLWRSQRSMLGLAALATGLAMLTRYIGVAFLITGILAVLLLGNKRPKQRLLDSLFFGAFAILPNVVSVVWGYLQTAHIGDRYIILNNFFFKLASDYLAQINQVLNSWLPFSERGLHVFPPAWRLLLIAAIVLILLVVIWLRLRGQPQYIGVLRYTILMTLFCIIYLFCLGLSYVFTNPPVAIDNRMLSPLLPAFFSLAIGLLAGLASSFPRQTWVQVVGIGIMVAAIVYTAPQTWRLATQYHATGNGYTAINWHAPKIFDQLEELPTGTTVITNDPALILFYLNWFPYDLTGELNTSSNTTKSIYGSGSGKMEHLFKSGAAMVLFMPLWAQTFGSQADEKLSQFTQGLVQYYSGPAYQIYYYPSVSHTNP